ncbi:MAG: GLPGLI family protein, partial [Bacteroidetes bacterium]|nr:GLPGLI family protein [Bacteroidota bacterium]
RILFKEKIKFDLHLDGLPPSMMDSLPKESTSEMIFLFTPEATLYKNNTTGKEVEPEPMGCGGGTGVKIVMANPEEIVYCDMKEMKAIDQKEFMSRNFLISSDLNRFQWKLTGKQKKVASYPCQEAIGTDTAKMVTAWFTTLIPVPAGPSGYGNLPGMILELIPGNGDRVITAQTVEIKDIDKTVLKKPRKGKKVSREEYNAIVDKKMKEMGQEGGGGHQIMIKIAQ